MLAAAPIYSALAAALRERLVVIGDRAGRDRDPQEHLARLQSASERISALQAQIPMPIPQPLAHYLERCSYDKALAWIENEG